MRLKRFAPTLADTKLKMAERFILGLDAKIRHILEAIDPIIYEVALRAVKGYGGT